MSEQKFNNGDVVSLKSGGPKMTVTSVGEDTYGTMSVFVTWFDKNNQRSQDSFPIDAVDYAPSGGTTFRVGRS